MVKAEAKINSSENLEWPNFETYRENAQRHRSHELGDRDRARHYARWHVDEKSINSQRHTRYQFLSVWMHTMQRVI
jgi:hypothetical protein